MDAVPATPSEASEASEALDACDASTPSTPSLVSSDDSRDTVVRRNVRELERTLAKMSVQETRTTDTDTQLHRLYNTTMDTWCRLHLDAHTEPSPRIRKTIQDRARRHYPHGMALQGTDQHDRNAALPHTCPPDLFSPTDLPPDMHPFELLRLLKAHEKYLLIEQWRQLWDEVRPARPRWYELKSNAFSSEMGRHRRVLADPRRQEMEYRTREMLVDLYRTAWLDATLMTGDGGWDGAGE
ncbi:hypothetical protein BC831DRAFT_450898 [Entophlyctis helioformis]|nr:hypothetical protein BC831DRAFT_450898 [Entophlyctis helioformis]